MGKYFCKTCGYSTDILCNMNKHKETKRHINNVKESRKERRKELLNKKNIPSSVEENISDENKLLNETTICNIEESISVPINDDKSKLIEESNKLKCDACGYIFAEKRNLTKHIKLNRCKSMKEDDKKMYKVIEKMDEKIEKMQTTLKKSNTGNTTTNIIVNYNLLFQILIEQKFINAPVLLPMDIARLPESGRPEYSIPLLIEKQRDLEMVNHLGDIIVGYYKKDDPFIQSFWTLNRYNPDYLTRCQNGDIIYWQENPTGKIIKNTVIYPLLISLKIILEKCYQQKKYKENGIIYKISDDDATYINIIIEDIDNYTDGLGQGILKYIAEHFHPEKNEELISIKNKDNKSLQKQLERLLQSKEYNVERDAARTMTNLIEYVENGKTTNISKIDDSEDGPVPEGMYNHIPLTLEEIIGESSKPAKVKINSNKKKKVIKKVKEEPYKAGYGSSEVSDCEN